MSSAVTPHAHGHTGTAQTPNSESSYEDRILSSPSLQPSSSDVSRSTCPGFDETEQTTPSTSTFSSQGEESTKPDLSLQAIQLRDLAAKVSSPPAAAGPRPSSDSSVKILVTQDLSFGQKRTASGQTKRSSVTSVEDLQKQEPPGTRHARTASVLSNSSNGSVAEVHR